MARFRIFDAAPDYQYWGNLPAPIDASMVTAKTPTSFAFELANTGDYAGWTMTVAGTGFTYLNNGSGVKEPTDGTVTSITIRDGDGNVVLIADQFPNAERPQLTDIYTTMFDTGGDWTPSPSMWDLFTSLNSFDDTIIGSNQSDDIFTGRNLGNDTIMARGGDDYVKGDPGNDTIDGGDGYDTISYTESVYDYTAFRGINLNVATGKVTDCWGGHDIISNFEEFQGSRMRDVLIGSDADREIFRGFRGADTINGKGGNNDWVRYDQDAHYGGKLGIICNLDDGTGTNGNIKGTIRDGFGQTDTILNIERVMGTDFNDKFVGSAADNVFVGRAGRDSYNGRAGWDRIDFGDAPNAVNVNLRLTKGQIINDGYGNTENAANIESIIGSDFADKLRGSDNADRLEGGRGDDILKGNGGGDFFHFSAVDQLGDTILDFTTGEDKINLDGTAIGIDATWKLVNSAADVTTTDSTFYMSGQDLMLDVDGTGAAAAVRVATIQVGGIIAVNDFDIYF